MTLLRANLCHLLVVPCGFAVAIGCEGAVSPSGDEQAGTSGVAAHGGTGGIKNEGGSNSRGEGGSGGDAGCSASLDASARRFCVRDGDCAATESCDLANCVPSNCYCSEDGDSVCTADCRHVCVARAGDGPENIRDGAAIFTDESDVIDVSWFSFWAGGYRLRRTREQLSPEQLRLAQEIRTVSSSAECWEDAAEVAVTVTSGAQSREYRANEYNGSCGREGLLVGYDAVASLLGTVNCLSAKGYDATELDAAQSIEPDDGCYHGLFNVSGAAPTWWFRIDIEKAGEYRAAVDGCGDRDLSLTFLDPSGVAELATSARLDAGCTSLSHRFSEPGRYVLKVDMHAGKYAGDFYLHVDSAPNE